MKCHFHEVWSIYHIHLSPLMMVSVSLVVKSSDNFFQANYPKNRLMEFQKKTQKNKTKKEINKTVEFTLCCDKAGDFTEHVHITFPRWFTIYELNLISLRLNCRITYILMEIKCYYSLSPYSLWISRYIISDFDYLKYSHTAGGSCVVRIPWQCSSCHKHFG